MQDQPDPGRGGVKVCGGVQQQRLLHSEKPKTNNTMKTLNNNVRLIGNLGFDPEVREIAKGRKVARLSLATHERYTNGEGEKVTDTQWHTVVAWGRIADQVDRLLAKGSAVLVEGRLVHRSYSGKDGVKRFITEVVLNDFKLLNIPKREEATAAKAA